MTTNPDGSPIYFQQIPQAAFDKCLSVVQKAQQAWVLLVAEFAAENLALGITQPQAIVIGTALNQVMTYGAEGSLWLAFDALSQVKVTSEMAPFLTHDRIQWMKNKMITVIGQLS